MAPPFISCGISCSSSPYYYYSSYFYHLTYNTSHKSNSGRTFNCSSHGAIVVARSCLHSLSSCHTIINSRSRRIRARRRGSIIRGRRNDKLERGSYEEEIEKETKKELAEEEDPGWVRGAVSAATQLLRIFSRDTLPSSSSVDEVLDAKSDEAEFMGIQDVIARLEDDYKRSYFLTGNFADVLYAEDCVFADPTVQFSGRDLYRRNLKLLVPFYEKPSLTLLSIEKENDGGSLGVKALWKLRTYLKFPWKPFISVDGQTIYNLNSSLKIVKHVESWNISAFEAIASLFVPSDKAIWNKNRGDHPPY